jgi:hypothetical protein
VFHVNAAETVPWRKSCYVVQLPAVVGKKYGGHQSESCSLSDVGNVTRPDPTYTRITIMIHSLQTHEY